jgi:hypothetical protein
MFEPFICLAASRVFEKSKGVGNLARRLQGNLHIIAMFISLQLFRISLIPMKKGVQKKRRRVIIIAIFSIAIIAVIVYLIVILQSQNIRNQSFIDSYESLVSRAHILTQSYQNEVGKWQIKQYDNKTMISITNDYLPKYKGLVNESMTLNPSTKQYQNAVDLYMKSIEAELESNIHFRNYLSTGKLAENGTSARLLSDALRYETDSFAAFKSAR